MTVTKYKMLDEIALIPHGQYVLEVEGPSGKTTHIPLRREDVIANKVEGYPVCIEERDGIYYWLAPEKPSVPSDLGGRRPKKKPA